MLIIPKFYYRFSLYKQVWGESCSCGKWGQPPFFLIYETMVAIPIILECGIMASMNTPSITVIDDKNLRGIVAPSSLMSREMLEDFIDIVEYSNPKIVERIERERTSSKGKYVDGRKLRKELGV